MVTNALVALGTDFPVSDGAKAVVDGDYLGCSVRSILEAHFGTLSNEAKFKLSHQRSLGMV